MKKLFVLAILVAFCVSAVFGLAACNDEEVEDDSYYYEDFETTESTVETLTTMLGGYVKGVCHPNEDYEQIAAANIEWVRFDISNLPFNKDGTMNEGYLAFKERAKAYADHGFKVFAVTPYPEDYIEFGLDPREEENELEIMKIAKFYIEDLQGIVAAVQVTNEMGIDHFTLPLTIEEAARFIGIQLKAMYRARGNIAIGYNLGGIGGYVTLNLAMKPYLQYVDYVGADIYLGCFEAIMTTMDYYGMLLELAHSQTGKPIILTEFGYIGAGQQKTDAEKLALLQSYGAVGSTLSEAEAYVKTHLRDIIYDEDFPAKFREHLKLVGGIDEENMTQAELDAAYEKEANSMFGGDLISHLYCELGEGFQMDDYEHTAVDQGKFFTDCLAYLSEIEYLCGTIMYCYSDSDACYICGQADCPVETGWGLIDGEGNPKPSYNAVKTAYATLGE